MWTARESNRSHVESEAENELCPAKTNSVCLRLTSLAKAKIEDTWYAKAGAAIFVTKTNGETILFWSESRTK